MAPSPVEEVASEGVRVSFFDLEGCRIELLEGTSPESPVRKFLDKKRTGVHHISIRLEDGGLDGFLESLVGLGVPVIGEAPRPGSAGSRIFFVHPRAAWSARMMFSRIVSSSTRPSVLRFSGQNATPSPIATRGFLTGPAWRHSVGGTGPAVRSPTPNSSGASRPGFSTS